jgi:hypothetical protein
MEAFWEIVRNEETSLFDIRNGQSQCVGHDHRNLDDQLAANGFSDPDRLDVYKQLQETGKATINIWPVTVRQVDPDSPIRLTAPERR